MIALRNAVLLIALVMAAITPAWCGSAERLGAADLSAPAISVLGGQCETVAMTFGGIYGVVVKDPKIVDASTRCGNVLVVTPMAPGNTVITVYDERGKYEFAVTVSTASFPVDESRVRSLQAASRIDLGVLSPSEDRHELIGMLYEDESWPRLQSVIQAGALDMLNYLIIGPRRQDMSNLMPPPAPAIRIRELDGRLRPYGLQAVAEPSGLILIGKATAASVAGASDGRANKILFYPVRIDKPGSAQFLGVTFRIIAGPCNRPDSQPAFPRLLMDVPGLQRLRERASGKPV